MPSVFQRGHLATAARATEVILPRLCDRHLSHVRKAKTRCLPYRGSSAWKRTERTTGAVEATMARSEVERKGSRMINLRGNCTSRSLWFAAVGSFALIVCVGATAVLAAPVTRTAICHNGLNIVVGEPALAAHLAHGDTVGTCDNVCACQPSIDPVFCESTGQTYINQCIADCAGATGCARVCACQPEIDPVTCANGNTYINPCVA